MSNEFFLVLKNIGKDSLVPKPDFTWIFKKIATHSQVITLIFKFFMNFSFLDSKFSVQNWLIIKNNLLLKNSPKIKAVLF